jgi:Carboxypeptidase regulatory-like domain
MRAIILRIASAAMLVLGLAATADAQYSAAVRGIIHDAKGRPAPGVVVTLSHPTTRVIRVALTDLRGEYVIRGLEPGVEYVVHVTHPNYRKERLEARAYAAVQEPTRVQLKPRRTAAVR